MCFSLCVWLGLVWFRGDCLFTSLFSGGRVLPGRCDGQGLTVWPRLSQTHAAAVSLNKCLPVLLTLLHRTYPANQQRWRPRYSTLQTHPYRLVCTGALSLLKASGLPVCRLLFVLAFAVTSAVVDTVNGLSCLSRVLGVFTGFAVLRISYMYTFLIYLNLTLTLLHFQALDLPGCILMNKILFLSQKLLLRM